MALYIPLSIFCLMVAAGNGEGSGKPGIVAYALEKLYDVFIFPTETLFGRPGPGWFLPFLFIDCLFYSFLTERLIALIKFLRKKKTLLNQ